MLINTLLSFLQAAGVIILLAVANFAIFVFSMLFICDRVEFKSGDNEND